jgi:hypothetical protein
MWALVMSKNTGFGGQSYTRSDSFPDEYIAGKLLDNYHITSIGYGGGEWVVVMSTKSGYTGQRWWTRTRFPEAEIKEGWNDDYQVTSLGCGAGTWALVMSRASGHRQQHYLRKIIPYDEIDEYRRKGYHVSAMAYYKDVFLTAGVVMSLGPFYGRMSVHSESSFPKDWVKARWDEGLDITCVCHDGEGWEVFMHSGTGYTVQCWETSKEFPREEIEKKWNEDYYITNLCGRFE